MVRDLPGVALNNPSNIHGESQNNLPIDQRTGYIPGADVGDVDSANVAQIIILAQAQAKAITAGTVSNTDP